MNTGRAPRSRRACAMPTQFSAAPKLASGNSAMVGAARAVIMPSARPADHAEQRRRAAAGRLRPLAARQPQMHLAADRRRPRYCLLSSWSSMARCSRVDCFSRKTLTPCSAPGRRRSLRWSASASADEAVGGASRDHAVKLECRGAGIRVMSKAASGSASCASMPCRSAAALRPSSRKPGVSSAAGSSIRRNS